MFFRRLNWNVVGWYRTVSAISIAIIAAGAAMIVFNLAVYHYPIKLGLSFTGGSDISVKFTKPVTPDAIASALRGLGAADPQITTLGKAGDPPGERFTITTQKDLGDESIAMWKALGAVAPVDRAQSQLGTVGPSLSHEYLIAAVEALVIAIGIQFLYIAFRFGWNYIFGLVTVIALVRDAGMMIGIYALAQKRADDAFLAAILTVIGYSVMDTIVILDRIRENVKTMPGEKYDRIVNVSILQTMTRSLNTLATVVITLVALLAFGGASLQNFAFALLVGICSGGYHSIFYSAPLVSVLRERQLRSAAGRRQLARESGERPRTVAEARAQAAGVSREDVLAARKERRKKSTSARPTAGPARYKRKRPASDAASGSPLSAAETSEYDGYDDDEELAIAPDELGHPHDHVLDLEPDQREPEHDDPYVDEYGRELDPLDAQNAGIHERDLHLGHEEIRLNLDDVDEAGSAPPPPATAKRE